MKINKDLVLVLVSGGFDPLHTGHISYLKEASKLGDKLVVALNSDEWLINKKGNFFLDFTERSTILINLEMVDEVISFDDSDNTAIDAIKKINKKYKKVIFANGGDRNDTNIPELEAFKTNPEIKFIYSVGGDDKKNSSSSIIQSFMHKESNRRKNILNQEVRCPWGSFTIIDEGTDYKVKQIKVNIGEQLSLQYHNFRTEHWFVVSGSAEVILGDKKFIKKVNDYIYIPKYEKHRIKNISDKELIFIEINHGKYIEEDDIVRLEDNYGRVK
jgi:cytidyltransferase-like protein